jgi:hypothetical protein
MEKIEIHKPIDLFVAFEIWGNKLKTLHEDHYFRFVCAHEVMDVCSIICREEYHTFIGELFPSDERLHMSIQAIELISRCKEANPEIIGVGRVLIERVVGEENKNTKAELRKVVSSALALDREIQNIVRSIKGSYCGSMTPFKQLRLAMRQSHKGNALMKGFRIKNVSPLQSAE